MRPVRPLAPAPTSHQSSRPRRSAAVALAAATLVALAPSAAVAADVPAPEDEESQPETDAIVLPAVEQVNQVVPVEEPVAAEAPAVEPVAEEPVAEEPAAEEPAADAQVSAPEAEPSDAEPTDAEPTDAEPTDAEPIEDEPAGRAGSDITDAPLPPAAEVLRRSLPAAPEAPAPQVAALAGDYGLGKVNASVLPVGGAPGADLSNAAIQFDAFDEDGALLESVTSYTDVSGWVPQYNAPRGATVVAQLTAAPEGFMTGAADQSFAPCLSSYVYLGWDFPCPQGTAVFEVVADYRRVGVATTSAGTGAAVEGATFELHAPAANGGAVVATGTTDAAGSISFAGQLIPGSGYTLVNTAAAPGHVVTAPVVVDLPSVTTLAEADVPLVVPVALTPEVDAPVAPGSTATVVSDGSTLFIDVLSLVDGDGAEVELVSATTSAGGRVTIGTDPGCSASCTTGLLYGAARRFSGVETITYRVSSIGGETTGTVRVTVTAPAPVPSRSDVRTEVVPVDAGSLAATGSEPWALGAVAGLLVLSGAGLSLTARRRSTTGLVLR